MEATKIPVDPPNIQASSPSHYEQRPPSTEVPNHDKGRPNVQDPKHIEKNDAPTSFHEHSSRSSPHPKKFDYSNNSANNSISSGTYPPNSKPHGTENQGMEFRNSYSGNERTFSSPRQRWNMEFKDATAAAQAAAESAERASMAARAAAELSSRGNISQQYSTESLMSSPHGMRDDEPWEYTGSASQNEHLARHPVNISLHGRNSTNYEQTDSNEQHNRAGESENVYGNNVRSGVKSTHSSFKSTAASFNEEPSVNNQILDAYSLSNSSEGRQIEHFAEVSMKRNSGENGMQFVNELHDINPQNVDHHEVRIREQSRYSSSHSQSNSFTDDRDVVSNLNWQKSENDKINSGESRMQFVNELHDKKNSDFADYQEVRIRKQSSYSSSHSLSGTFADDHNVVLNLNRQKLGNNSGEDSFLLNDEGSLQRTTKDTTDSYDNASAVFDDYGSDNDEDNFDLEEEHKVPEYGMNFSSPGQRSPTHPFTSTNSWSVEQDVKSPAKPISQSHIFSEQRSTPVFFESSTSSTVPSHGDDLPATFDNYGPSSESEEEVDNSKYVRTPDLSIGSHIKNMNSHQAENSNFSPQLAEGMEDTEHSNHSNMEESKELNFGKLTGGLRNKGYRHPPYSKIPQGNALSSGEAANDTSSRIKQSSSAAAAVEASVSSGSYNQEPHSWKGSDEGNRKLSTRASVTHVDSSDDDSEEEQPKQTFSSTQDQYNKTPSFEENKRLSLRARIPYFGSGNSDSDEDIPKTSFKAHSNTGFSRRTRAYPSNSRRSSNLKSTISSEPTVVSSYDGEKNSFSRSSNADELSKTQPQKKNSDHWESFHHSQLASQATSRLVSETKRSSFDGTLTSEKELSSTSVPKIIPSDSAKSLKAQTSIREGPSKEKASHVHPKLPDYDILTAQLYSLRQNRQ
ncbi:uncharacterized protein LOC111303133 isoform X2 [Durio zibethinus]|nr:uncharacterized protein LOC111303133 isoform X2 [Durio zibethinus]